MNNCHVTSGLIAVNLIGWGMLCFFGVTICIFAHEIIRPALDALFAARRSHDRI